MKTKKIVSILSLLIFGLTLGHAQNVTGIVYLVDEPVAGAKITVLSNAEKVRTDHNGYFSIPVEGLTKLDINYKGLISSMTVNSITGFIDVVLMPSEKQLIGMIEKSPSLAKCDAFITNYPNSGKIEIVNTAKEELIFIEAYDAAVGDSNLLLLEKYLAQYPNSNFSTKAEKTLDVVSWQKARSIGTQSAYEDYLTKFPNGAAVKLAKEKVAMK